MSIEDRVVSLEQAFLALSAMVKRADERQDTVGESINLLTKMIEHHEQRLDGVHAEQSNADERIAALADAQIRTEGALKELSAIQSNADERIAALADAQIRTEASQSHADERIAALADAHIKTEEALAKLTEKLHRLADTVERHIKEGH
ncbi:MAG TPA: hypothetical protein VF553_02595 [Pyrinomonadaceae bacterium]